MSKQLAGVMRLDKRTARRFETSLQVLFVWRDRVVEATAVDVSMTGMRLTCEVDIEIGTELHAHFAPQGGRATHQLDGRIVWSRPSEEIAGVFYAGLHYSALPPGAADALAALVRMLGGETAIDDLPVVEAEEVEETAAPVPSSIPSLGPVPTLNPSANLNPSPEPDFAAVAVPLPAPPPTPAPGSPTGSSPGSLFGEAEPWRITEQLESAVAEDFRRREEDRRKAEEHLGRARSAQEAGRLEEAVPLLREAADLVPDSPEIYEELAAAVYLSGRVVESAKLFDRALRLRLERGD